MPKKGVGILSKNNCILLVIDVQEKFRPAINNFSNTAKNIEKLIEAFNILKIPIILTEQYPKGLGKTIKEIDNLLKNNKNINKIEKTEFSCFDNKKFDSIIKKLNKKNIIICGMEAHICVLKTILNGIKNSYNMHLVADAVSSRKILDKNVAIERIKKTNAYLTTTESIIFQLIKSSKEKRFREMSKIIK